MTDSDSSIPADAGVVMRLTLDHLLPKPDWDAGECVGSVSCVVLSVDQNTPPGEHPVLSLCNFDHGHVIVGEIWFYPADLPDMIHGLQELLDYFRFNPHAREYYGPWEAHEYHGPRRGR